jgi:ABC-type transporter Mla MlaB component
MENNAFNITSRKDKKKDVHHITLEGDLGINQIEKVKTAIESVLTGSKEIVIELKNINAIDLSTGQLLYSLKKAGNGNGNKVKIEADLNENGFSYLKNCDFNVFIQ